MNFKYYTFLFISCLFVFTACQNQSGNQDNKSVKTDSLDIGNLEKIITTESQLLGEPREIESLDENHLAVYDHGYKQIIVFNKDGEKKLAFGQTGDGPGEWGEMAGATDLDYQDQQFFTTNRSRFIFDLYDSEGNHLHSVPFPPYLSNTDKKLLSDDHLLIATDGRENSLAAVLDLQKDAEIVQRIGSPESEFAENRNHEEERITYAEGEIPENALNDVLVAKEEEGYFLFMNALGELRHYTDDGKRNMQLEIPNSIKEPIFNFVVTRNKDEVPEHTVVPLKYAKDIQVKNGLIYIYMPKPTPAVENLDSQLLVFNSDGEFLKHFIFQDPENKSFLYDFVIAEDDSIYLIDIMNARVLRLQSD